MVHAKIDESTLVLLYCCDGGLSYRAKVFSCSFEIFYPDYHCKHKDMIEVLQIVSGHKRRHQACEMFLSVKYHNHDRTLCAHFSELEGQRDTQLWRSGFVGTIDITRHDPSLLLTRAMT
jgi:hypothetical protein